MRRKKAEEGKMRAPQARAWSLAVFAAGLVVAGAAVVYALNFSNLLWVEYERARADVPVPPAWPLSLDVAGYNARLLALAHYVAPVISSTTLASVTVASTSGASAPSSMSTTTLGLPHSTATSSVSVLGHRWPVATAYPQGGAILPFNRVVAYYGNFYSKRMGVLGEYPTDQLLEKLASTTAEWAAADPATPVIPAIQYIAVVAQGSSGKDGKYRLEMPNDQIDHALALADQIHGLLFLDVQVGKSTLQAELPELEKYLKLPQVHLAIDPEFSMKGSYPPGTVIGTYDASDINYAASYLANLVRENRLPPKILVVHRFTYDMVTNYQEIAPLPEVEVVMDMDGWGTPAKKFGTYNAVIAPFPVQFTGMKLFYHADLKPPSTRMLTPAEVLSLTPAPSYIQYQ